jgi:hypothetical protein
MSPAQLWADTETEGRRAIAEAIFNRIDAVGLDLVIHPSAEAERYGWSEAFGPDPIVCSIGQTGWGERTRSDTIPIWGWVTPPPGFRLVREDSA